MTDGRTDGRTDGQTHMLSAMSPPLSWVDKNNIIINKDRLRFSTCPNTCDLSQPNAKLIFEFIISIDQRSLLDEPDSYQNTKPISLTSRR